MASSSQPKPQTWKSLSDLSAYWDDMPLAEQTQGTYINYNDMVPDWQEAALCAQIGQDVFFGDDRKQLTMSIRQVRDAGAICATCPVFRTCLTSALENNEEYGVWAGTSGRTRRKIRKWIAAGTSIQQIVKDYCNGAGRKYEQESPDSGPPRGASRPEEGEGVSATPTGVVA